MRFQSRDSSASLAKVPVVVAFATEGRRAALPAGVRVPSSALSAFKGAFRDTRLVEAQSGPAARVLLVGLGKRSGVDAEKLRRAAALGVQKAEETAASSAALWIGGDVEQAVGGAEAAGRAVAEGAIMGVYAFERFKSKPSPKKLKSVSAWGSGADFKRGAAHGKVLAEANCFARDLQNTPGNLMRPRDLASEARKLARRSARLTCRVLDEAAMKKLGMGSLLSVSQGSVEPAYLIHLSYKPAGAAKKRAGGRVALVGKGLTFDAGGISLKPSAKMEEMKFDMSGGAAVLGVFHALASVDVPFEVHGLVPTSENLPDADATKPGDLVTAMNGTTIEVLNTDAEGRLILADALVYADKKVKADTIVDLATLTGAVVVALGHELAGLFATTDALRDGLLQAGLDVEERLWPLPLLDCHKEQMKGRVGDLRNINSPGTGNGSTAGAAFLSNFVGKREWAHLDIAGSAWGGLARDYVGGPDGSGVGVRLLLRWLEQRGGGSRRARAKRGSR